MAKVNAQQWLQKWGNNLNAASQYITSGVNRVQTAPGVQAAAAAPTMLANLTTSVTSGAWAARVSSVSLQQWQQSMTQKGIPRIAQGVTSAQANKSTQITNFLSAVDAAVADTNATPRGNLEQNIARSAAFQRSMSARAPRKQK
jgi:hypothetical protein